MHVTKIMANSDATVLAQANRVMGVVDGYLELDRLARELESLGVTDLEVLEGASGEKYLDQWEHSLTGLVETVLGDLESEMRRQYLLDIKEGHIVFAVPVSRDNSQELAVAVRACGAEHVASFGALVNESFESSIDPAV